MTFHDVHRTHIVLVGFLILLIGAIVILSWVPPISRDALTHHLAIPKLYLKHGGIYEIPDRPFSYYPMNLDLLYLVPLYFGNDIIPKLIHFFFALLTAWLIYGYLKKRTDSRYALLGALFFLSIPIIVKLSITVYVDLGLIFFTTASLLLLLKWIETEKIHWLILSGIMCGLALGTKYNGLISLLLLTLSVPVIYLRHPWKKPQTQLKSLGHTVLFVLVALVIFSPWMIRNYLWTQNPLYPLYNQWFKPATFQTTETQIEGQEVESNSTLKPFTLRKVVYKESGWEIITIPIRIFFAGKDDDPKRFDGKLNPFLILLPLLLIIGFRNQSTELRFEIKFFSSFSALFILFVFFQQDMRIRYIGSVIPLLVILSIIGLYNLNTFLLKIPSQAYNKLLSTFQLVIISLFLLYNILYIAKQFNILDPFSYMTGKIDRGNYIERFRPEYEVIRYANHNLSKTDKVIALFLGDRGYYMDFDVSFDKTWFQKLIVASPSSGNALMEIKKNGINHLILRFDLLNDWINTSLDEKQKTTLVAFFQNHTRLLYSKAGYGLYIIIP